jgi:predicted dehydrogenase
VKALERGPAVFCQKPLGRTAAEARRVVDAARAADRLLAVDLSYRHVVGVAAVRDLVRSGDLGRVYAVDLGFHNGYGPDKPWFYDRALSGGGCVMDLGIHLVDLALWSLGFPEVEELASRLVQLACSWRLPAGRDCVIEASFYGTGGGAALRNVNGSFYDFEVERLRGTARERLAGPPDAWVGRAAVAFTERLAGDGRFDPEVEGVVQVSPALDAIYAAARPDGA